jgi:hypothetical protein
VAPTSSAGRDTRLGGDERVRGLTRRRGERGELRTGPRDTVMSRDVRSPLARRGARRLGWENGGPGNETGATTKHPRRANRRGCFVLPAHREPGYSFVVMSWPVQVLVFHHTRLSYSVPPPLLAMAASTFSELVDCSPAGYITRKGMRCLLLLGAGVT